MDKIITDEDIVKKYTSLQSSARSRKIPFELSLRKMRSLLNAKTCYYTGLVFSETIEDLKRSIDRVDSSRGYVDDNVVPCIVRINNLKSNIDYKELMLILKGMKKFYSKIGVPTADLLKKKMYYEEIKPEATEELLVA
jgi:hypothetical protein